MYSRSMAAGRFSFLRNPAGVAIGYVLTLFAIVAGAGAFPFSNIWMALLFVMVGAFFVVAVPVLVMVYLFFFLTVCRALMALRRRLRFGTDRTHESQRSSKSSLQQKDLESHGTYSGLWDRWIDGL
jgi:hypothetical protein